ncbi:hypothetical protein BDZ90DRAFT_6777 [Jaminaea rosea]|uniref:RRM domain-containing protein n=1 Tax=Jaminaea rosea TaxID=1569628 RepID=A0A316V1Y6_9BASI|nr:hypothetical protein BDZ90DRAFT_6777 [Jaminaea rosea]PWN30193.1 hypothetical protein BDZ90DRAFT_6777 [Jaminaea rosea]
MYARARDAAVAIVELQKKGFQTSFARHESFSAKLRMMSDSRSTNVYISNLPLAMGEEELEALVRPHQIISRRILTKPDGTSRGVGFIRFQSRDIAQSCIDLLHGRRLDGHPHPLQARFADSESQKRLKQDTTLRKIYADLDMGVLRSPSGHNLRPTPLSNNNVWASGANYGAGRYGVVPHGAQVASSAMQAMTGAIPMRFTNSEPGMPRHAGQRIANKHQHLHQQIHHNQQQQQHQQLMRAAGQYSAAVPMSATTSNASFYPGAPFTGTPPTSMSPWVAASGGGVIATTDTDIGVASGLWTQPGSPLQPIFNAQTAANMGPNGWLLPSSTAATAVGIKSAPQVDKTKAVNNRLWSPLLSTDGNLAPASPSIDGSTVGTNTTFNSPVFPANEGSFASMAKPAQWVAPTFNAVPRIRMADGTESSALEQKHLGSLLTSGINGGSGGLGDGAATSGTGNGNANQQDWLQHYALNGDAAVMMYPPELNFVRASGQTSAVPIINPQTGQRFQGKSSTGNEADDAMSEAHASSGSHEQQQRGMQEMGTSKSTPNALSDMAATPTIASSVSAPTGLNQQQGH